MEGRYKDLRDARYQNGDLTQTAAAEKLGISVAQYGKIEKGDAVGSVNIWLRIQKLFNLSDAEVWQMISRK